MASMFPRAENEGNLVEQAYPIGEVAEDLARALHPIEVFFSFFQRADGVHHGAHLVLPDILLVACRTFP